MGRQSLDIDIALDNMLGKEFADEVNKYLKSHVRTSAFCQSGFSMNRLY
jgi:hypothetical protein